MASALPHDIGAHPAPHSTLWCVLQTLPGRCCKHRRGATSTTLHRCQHPGAAPLIINTRYTLRNAINHCLPAAVNTWAINNNIINNAISIMPERVYLWRRLRTHDPFRKETETLQTNAE